MKIPIQVRGKRLEKFTKVFFRYLESDIEFEELIMNARRKLNLSVEASKAGGDLDIVYIQPKALRSEIKNLKSFDSQVVYLGNPELEKQLEIIIKQYPFMKDWIDGISHFVCGDRFFIDSNCYPIKLRVRNKKYSHKGVLTDRPSEEGVKIVINGVVSKNEIKSWIDNNYKQIMNLLKEIQSSSENDPRRGNFERDRLIVYLRDKWKLTFGKIVEVLTTNGEPVFDFNSQLEADYKMLLARVMKAYKEFPSKYNLF